MFLSLFVLVVAIILVVGLVKLSFVFIFVTYCASEIFGRLSVGPLRIYY